MGATDECKCESIQVNPISRCPDIDEDLARFDDDSYKIEVISFIVGMREKWKDYQSNFRGRELFRDGTIPAWCGMTNQDFVKIPNKDLWKMSNAQLQEVLKEAIMRARMLGVVYYAEWNNRVQLENLLDGSGWDTVKNQEKPELNKSA